MKEKARYGVTEICVMVLLALCQSGYAQEQDESKSWLAGWPFDLHGFHEFRGGYRIVDDENQKDMSIMEQRHQIDLSSFPTWGEIRFKADFIGDYFIEEFDYDIREAYLFLMPADNMDMWVGRQILTWGTGDLIFINDMFPKDWQSFFIGRDTEYLKAPSDAVKLSIFEDFANIDIVYTPQFDMDRYIDGERVSYWSSTQGRFAGENDLIAADEPDDWFEDDEIAMRIYKNIDNYEVAFYGYRGFWKSPGGINTSGRAIFPDLNVYGASIRGQVGKGIGNLEFGYYDSADDRSGTDPMVNNSEMRFLAGYSQEIARNLTLGMQYYLETMTDYSEYLANLPAGPARDKHRSLLTFRLTKLSEDQKLTLSLFTYYSPTDKDVYIRPNVHYKAADNLAYELGSNIFFGDYPNTFFGQFENNTNLYAAVRYSF